MAGELNIELALVINNATVMAAPEGGSIAVTGNCSTGQTVKNAASIGSTSASLPMGGVVSPQFGLFINNDDSATVSLLDHSQGNATIAKIPPGGAELRTLLGSVSLYAIGTPSPTTGNTFAYLIVGQ